ncbi:AAA family ATPase [Bacillus cereus]|nr:AAA family ATPase [Bacillus cereus]MDA1769670.1 AAA family ATPase [Bacillus cereus]
MKFPLFIVTGVSGSGKSSIAGELQKEMSEFDVFDMDIIVTNNDYQRACHNWLKIAHYNALCGRNTVLFGNVPEPYNIYICDSFHLFDPIYYSHLHCSDAIRIQRLNTRKTFTKTDIQYTLNLSKKMFNKAQASVPSTHIVDTTNTPVSRNVADIKQWVLYNLSNEI